MLSSFAQSILHSVRLNFLFFGGIKCFGVKKKLSPIVVQVSNRTKKMPSSSSSSSQPNVSQHLKKFYNLLRDGGLIGLPPYEKVQFNRVIIKTNNTSSCNSYSKKNRSGSSSSSSTMNLSSPFESIKALRVKDAMELRRHIEKEVARTSKREIENFCFALESMIADEYFFSLCLIPFER